VPVAVISKLDKIGSLMQFLGKKTPHFHTHAAKHCWTPRPVLHLAFRGQHGPRPENAQRTIQRHEAKLFEAGMSIEEMRMSMDRFKGKLIGNNVFFLPIKYDVSCNVPFIQFWEDVLRQRTCHRDTKQVSTEAL